MPNIQKLSTRMTFQNRSFWYSLRARLKQADQFLIREFAEEQSFGHLFIWVPVLVGLGAVFWFSAEQDPPITGILLGMAISLMSAWRFSSVRQTGWYLSLAVFLVLAGMSLAALEAWRSNTVLLDIAVTTHVTARVVDHERMEAGQWRYTLDLISTAEPVLRHPPQRIILAGRSKGHPAEPGQIVTGLARLAPPSGPALPRLNDFARDAYFRSYGAVGYFYGAPHIMPDGNGDERDQLSARAALWLNSIRNTIGNRIQTVLPGDTGAFATSMVTDERRAISKETLEALRLSGLAHIVAISGLNMALASGIFFVGLRMLMSLSPELAQQVNTKKIAAAGALFALFAYYLIAGSAVSAERAFIMMAIILVAVLFGKPSISLRNIALSALVILVLSPSAVMGPSFQMSFAATLALVAGYHVWKPLQMENGPLAAFAISRLVSPLYHFFGSILLTSAIGGFSTAIFSAEHFNRLSAYGLPANLIAMPAVSFIVMPFGLIAMLLMPFGLDELPLRIMGFGIDITIASAKYVASWGGNIVTGRLDLWFFPMSSAALIFMCIVRSPLRIAGVVVFVMAIGAQILMPPQTLPDLVIYEDGTLAANLSEGAMALNADKPPAFLLTQWEYALGLETPLKPKQIAALPLPAREKGTPRIPLDSQQREQVMEAMLQGFATETKGQFLCAARQWCATAIRDIANVVIVNNSAFAGVACDVADIVIFSVSTAMTSCRSGAMLISRDILRKRGSLEITFPKELPETRLKTDVLEAMSIQGALDGTLRPWTKHRYYQWRTGQFDPPFGPAKINDSDG